MRHRLLAKPRIANTTLNDLPQVSGEYLWAIVNVSNSSAKAWSVIIYDARDWELRSGRAFRNNKLNETFSLTERNEMLDMFEDHGIKVSPRGSNKNLFCVKGETSRDKLAFLLYEERFYYCDEFEQWLSENGHNVWPVVFLKN